MTPRSVNSIDTGLDVIDVPRSAWTLCGAAAGAADRPGDEVGGQVGLFAGGDEPAGVVAGVDADQHVQVVEDPLARAAEFGVRTCDFHRIRLST